MTFGSRIRKVRRDMELSQVDFAKLLGKTSRTIQKWEYDQIIPPVTNIGEIARTLNVSENWLLTGQGELFIDKKSSPMQKDIDEKSEKELLLKIMLAVDEWLYTNKYEMKPQKKIEMIKAILQIYAGKEDKATPENIKEYAIPFVLQLVN